MVNKKVLFVVPHQDDEMLIGGAMLYALACDPKFEVWVYLATNGDYLPGIAGIRCIESIRALKVLGIDENHVFFGGFGNFWRGSHIYNCNNGEVAVSKRGGTISYCPMFPKRSLGEKIKNNWVNEGANYTRENYKATLKQLLLDLLPDYLFCIGFDHNQDHRGLSLICEEALCEILKEKPDYTPVYLIKFAYEGVWVGPADYYKRPKAPTVQKGFGFYTDENSLRFAVPKKCLTKLLGNNMLYRSSRKYRSQRIYRDAVKFINGDITYWQRRTDNLALRADIETSSGNASLLNDFKLFDTNDVIEWEPKLYGWRPDSNDSKRAIKISLSAPVSGKFMIRLFILESKENNEAEVTIDGATSRYPVTIGMRTIDCSASGDVSSVAICFAEDIEIGEIEVLSEPNPSGLELLPLPLVCHQDESKKNERAIPLAHHLSFLANWMIYAFDRVWTVFLRKRMAKKETGFID